MPRTDLAPSRTIEVLPRGFSAPRTGPTNPEGALGGSAPQAHLHSKLFTRAQGGVPLGPEQGELEADFGHLGIAW